MTAAAGTASRTPVKPSNAPPASSAKIIHTGCRPIRSPTRRGVIQSRDAVIGVVHGKEAKAYPITVMGVHELGNDTIDGIPIAVSW